MMELTPKEAKALEIFARTADSDFDPDYLHRTKMFTDDLRKHGFTAQEAGGLIRALEKKLICIEDDLYSAQLGDLMWANQREVNAALAATKK